MTSADGTASSSKSSDYLDTLAMIHRLALGDLSGRHQFHVIRETSWLLS